jgi:hypothetical protein
MNFTLNARGQNYVSDEPQKLPQRVINVVNVLARAELQTLPLRQAVRGSDALVQAVRKRLADSSDILQLGLEILGLSILAGLYKIMRGKSGREAVESAWADDSGCMT